MMSAKIYLRGLGMLALAFTAGAQTASAPANSPISFRSNAQIVAQARTLMEQARKSPVGNANATLETYPGITTFLLARARTGPAEMHANWDDLLIVLDGAATEVTGGKMIDGKLDPATGETRGSRVEGGTRTPLVKGDFMHVAANTPHWAVIAPGKALVMYVVKTPVSRATGSK